MAVLDGFPVFTPHERVQNRGHRLQVLRPSPACVKVFTITGLDRVFGLTQS